MGSVPGEEKHVRVYREMVLSVSSQISSAWESVRNADSQTYRIQSLRGGAQMLFS